MESPRFVFVPTKAGNKADLVFKMGGHTLVILENMPPLKAQGAAKRLNEALAHAGHQWKAESKAEARRVVEAIVLFQEAMRNPTTRAILKKAIKDAQGE